MPANETEIREFIRTLSNRAKNTRRSMESALDALDGMTGQMRL